MSINSSLIVRCTERFTVLTASCWSLRHFNCPVFNCASDLLSCTCEASPCCSFEPRTVKLLFKTHSLSQDRSLEIENSSGGLICGLDKTVPWWTTSSAVRRKNKICVEITILKSRVTQDPKNNKQNQIIWIFSRQDCLHWQIDISHPETEPQPIATSFTLVNATFLESEENMGRIDKKKAIMKQTSSVVKLKLFSDGQPVARIQWWTAFRPTESLIKVYLSICLLWWTGFSQILWIPVLPNCFVQD